MAQQPGLGIAGVDVALDPDDGDDVRTPVGVGQLVGGIRYYVAVTPKTQFR